MIPPGIVSAAENHDARPRLGSAALMKAMRLQSERRCADFGEVIARIRKLRTTSTDPTSRLRVYVPAHAPDRKRREIVKLGVEVKEYIRTRFRSFLPMHDGSKDALSPL